MTTMEGEPFSVFERSVVAAAPGVHEVRGSKLQLSFLAGKRGRGDTFCPQDMSEIATR